MSGDSLSVFLFLLAGALTMAVAAISLEPGWRTQLFWALAGIFIVMAGAWWLAPAASPLLQSIKPFAVALVQSGAAVMIGTVGTVSMMLYRQRPKAFDLSELETPIAEKTDQAIIKTLEGALVGTQISMSQGGTRGVERALPGIRAALLSAQKQFEIRLPQETGNTAVDMQTAQRFLEIVLPFLSLGHVVEARQEAEKFIERLS